MVTLIGTETPADVPGASSAPGAAQQTATLVDLAESSVRDLNQALHEPQVQGEWTVTNPGGKHSIAVGIDAPVNVTVEGHVGYYAAGMHQRGTVTVRGNAGVGLAENIMSGTVHVTGDASQSAGATGHGGLVVIDGNAGARCGISMKGVDVVVGGSIGHMSAFMAQAGRLVVCGDAGEALGDSIYEARLYVKGTVASLGADCVEKPMRDEHLEELGQLLSAAGRTEKASQFKRYGSARNLYHFHVDNSTSY
jgi:glutamate synthase domain-containing protein 3